MIEESEAADQQVTKEDAKEALKHVEELLSDQIAYHSVSRDRYSGVVKHLKRWSGAVSYIGFAIVILRALLQIALSVQGWGEGSYLAEKINDDVSRKEFIFTWANLAAYLIPAWALHFSSKLTFGNFAFNRDKHERMMKELSEELHHIEALRDAHEDLPSEALQDIGEAIAEIMLVKDNSVWGRKYKKLKITDL